MIPIKKHWLCFFGDSRYVDDDEGIRKYFAAFHLHLDLPAAVVIDDFGDFFTQL